MNKRKTFGISYITTWQERIINYLQKKIHLTNIVQLFRTFPGFFIKINKLRTFHKNKQIEDFPGHFSNSRTSQDFSGPVVTLFIKKIFNI